MSERPTPPPEQRAGRAAPAIVKLLGRIYVAYLTVRGLALVGSALATLIVVSSLVGSIVATKAGRLGLALVPALVLPLALQVHLRRRVLKRYGRRLRLGGPWFMVLWNASLVAVLALGFSDPTGRALRRRGDWFLGPTHGYLPRKYREAMAAVSRYLERFDPPPEAREIMADAFRPQPISTLPGPALPPPGPGPRPPVAAPGPEQTAAWFHPMAGPGRLFPPNAACRFGAHRPGPRPPECELGHCGVDLFKPAGTPVYAVQHGEVLVVQRNAQAGGISGRFVILSHRGGAVRSTYVHLEEIAGGLRRGDRVQAGQMIGTVGATGTRNSAPHLHFAVSVQKRGGHDRFLDPEPMLHFWWLPAAPPGQGAEPLRSPVAGAPPPGREASSS